MSLSRSWAIARHELRVLRSDPMFLVIFTVMPLLVMAFIKPGFRFALQEMGEPNANGAEQAVPGVSVMFSLFLVGSVGFAFFREHGWQTWERVRASGATGAEIMTGKVVVPLLQSALQLSILFGVGGALYGLRVDGSKLAIAVVAGAFCVCLVCLGLAIMSVCRTIMQVNAIANLGAMVLAGVGGALAPTTALPGWAQAIAPATPSYWAMQGFRDAIVGRAGAMDVMDTAAVLLLFATGFALVAAFRFRIDDAKVFFA